MTDTPTVEPGRRAWITHTALDGTRFEGDPRPHEKLVKDAGFEYRRTTGWYVLRSRDRVLTPYRQQELHDLACALNAVGFEVAVEVDNTPRTAQERYDDAEARSVDRREGLTAAAARRTRDAQAAWKRSDDLTEGRPPGQPILVGHHSQKADERLLARSARAMHRSMALAREAADLATRASRVSSRSSDRLGTILRRVEKLRKDLAKLDGQTARLDREDTAQTWIDWWHAEHDRLTGELALWERVVELRVEAGEKVWGPDDFKDSDRVVTEGGIAGRVEKINKKSLGVRYDVMPQFVQTVRYDKVLRRIRPEPVATEEESRAS